MAYCTDANRKLSTGWALSLPHQVTGRKGSNPFPGSIQIERGEQMNSLILSKGARTYEHRLGSIQAKRIYKKLLEVDAKILSGTPVYREEITSILDSFDFFLDILHMMDPEEDPDCDKDIELINLYGPNRSERKG